MNELWRTGILAILTIPAVFMMIKIMPQIGTGSLDLSLSGNGAENCAMSPYNTYSNSTNGYSYWLGKCYVQVTDYYMTKKECGFLGISCYESSEAHAESYTGEVCFKLKTGERC